MGLKSWLLRLRTVMNNNKENNHSTRNDAKFDLFSELKRKLQDNSQSSKSTDKLLAWLNSDNDHVLCQEATQKIQKVVELPAETFSKKSLEYARAIFHDETLIIYQPSVEHISIIQSEIKETQLQETSAESIIKTENYLQNDQIIKKLPEGIGNKNDGENNSKISETEELTEEESLTNITEIFTENLEIISLGKCLQDQYQKENITDKSTYIYDDVMFSSTNQIQNKIFDHNAIANQDDINNSGSFVSENHSAISDTESNYLNVEKIENLKTEKSFDVNDNDSNNSNVTDIKRDDSLLNEEKHTSFPSGSDVFEDWHLSFIDEDKPIFDLEEILSPIDKLKEEEHH
ncbi:uncharacterized protein LOC111634202 [Centruroides sculpturatus]|uniref:uncharacterized protein LOC111634202 n=1 Tax=Centruroides sculpturatus TaxID=218467 RepID=UPI000C6D81ED|nr:uncharacterized protein LOC111634202 [Centruroides sculpturatus]